MLTDIMNGKVYLVGIGTGDPLDLTPRAEEAIARANVVIGHGSSLDFIRRLLGGKEVVERDMSPLERSEAAVSCCLDGRAAAIISAGDPGVYAIASTFLNYLYYNKITIPVEIIPGITTSSSASARLGAPLGNDFAVISLADQAGHWPSVLNRIQQAAALDFVLVFYNPMGKMGAGRIMEACKALKDLKEPQTLVGVVSSAGREDESIQITSLGMLCQVEIPKDSLIVVGNSATFLYQKWMITPRAYQPGLGY